eukprot:867545-Rhodomonas_salina.1
MRFLVFDSLLSVALRSRPPSLPIASALTCILAPAALCAPRALFSDSSSAGRSRSRRPVLCSLPFSHRSYLLTSLRFPLIRQNSTLASVILAHTRHYYSILASVIIPHTRPTCTHPLTSFQMLSRTRAPPVASPAHACKSVEDSFPPELCLPSRDELVGEGSLWDNPDPTSLSSSTAQAG